MSNVSGAKKIGRPRVDTEAVNVRMPSGMVSAIDTWRGQHTQTVSRPEAVRHIVEDWLTSKGFPITEDHP